MLIVRSALQQIPLKFIYPDYQVDTHTTSNLRIAIVGATGAVGRVTLDLLKERRHPHTAIVALGSPGKVGRSVSYGGALIPVHETSVKALADVDVVFISANEEVSATLAPQAVKQGAVVIDDSAAFRMKEGVPLVVPEVNGADVEQHSGIIAIPNCAATPIALVAGALRRLAKPVRMCATTLQSASGAGTGAHLELLANTKSSLRGTTETPQHFPRPIEFNIIPQIGSFQANGYTSEEYKIMNEINKILHRSTDDPIDLMATCVRVPVEIGHSTALNIEFATEVTIAQALQALREFPGIVVLEQPEDYPTPRETAGRDATYVGRLRLDHSRPNALSMWITCDNLRKGAALNALQIVEEMVRRECLPLARSSSS